MSEVYKDWLLSAEMDIENVRVISGNELLTPIAIFHSHQCIEKSFKAYLEYHNKDVPKTHDLLRLFGIAKKACLFNSSLDEESLIAINEAYIDTRYPGDFGLLPDGKPSIEIAEKMYGLASKVLEDVKDNIL